MVTERSDLTIAEGEAETFATVMAEQGLPLLRGVPGVVSATLGRGVENPDKFMLLIDWETKADHTAFTKAPVFPEFIAMLRPYAVGGAMEHFDYR
jgi:heme-degrading monooxygenase HmoA